MLVPPKNIYMNLQPMYSKLNLSRQKSFDCLLEATIRIVVMPVKSPDCLFLSWPRPPLQKWFCFPYVTSCFILSRVQC